MPQTVCACNSQSFTDSPSGQSEDSGEPWSADPEQEELDAARRDAERANRAAGVSESTAPTNQTNEQAPAKAAGLKQEIVFDTERLRWKIAMWMGIDWISLTLIGWGGVSVHHWWNSVTYNWQQH